MTTIPQPDALTRFLQAASDDEAITILDQEQAQLLTDATNQALAVQLATESDLARREVLAARQALLQAAHEWRDRLATMSDAEQLLLAFRSVTSPVEMIRLAADVDAAALDALEQQVEAMLAAGDEDERTGLHERLASLREIRQQGVETLAAQLVSATEAAAQQAQALADRLIQWIRTPDWTASEAFLDEYADELLTDAGAATLQLLQEANEGNEEIALHIKLLAACRDQGVAAAYAQLRREMAMADVQGLAERLVAWIQTPDWAASETFLQEQADDLLTDAGAAALQMLQEAHAGNEQIALHIKLLDACRQQGIVVAYAQLRQELAAAAATKEALTNNPLLQAVVEFLQAESDEAARTVLANRRNLLLTLDARRHMEGFLAAARQQNDTNAQAHVAARLALWQAVRFGAPDQAMTQAGAAPAPLDVADTASQSNLLDSQASKYQIIEASYCAIGDNAQTLNILNMGVRVPLQWKKPQQFRRDLTERAVGRRTELADLHRHLQGDGDAAVVGSGAVRGLPGIGKSTLAALYAQAYAADFPGGVIWLQLGPSYTTPESVEAAISELAAFAYSGDVQAYQALAQASPVTYAQETLNRLRNALFKPEAVQLLLSGHGRLLLIVDDVWDVTVLEPVRRARPHDACLLVTTRDSRIANRLGNVLELDVLSRADARAMVGRVLPGMTTMLADRLAQVVGFHPLALEIALGDLVEQEPADWADAIQAIDAQVGTGESLDFLPLIDDNREQRLVAALRYSYGALAQRPNGATLQERFRSLGCFGREAAFSTAAAADLWATDNQDAKAYLQVLRARSLLNRLPDERWQQHTILRGYARHLQAKAEAARWAERHAEHYLAQMRTADDQQVYYEMAPDLPNLRHAFAWAVEEGLALAQALLSNSADLLRSQNLGAEYLSWAERVVARARTIGDPADVGSALLSLGNARQAAATVVYGKDRGQRLREALAAYDEALALRREVPLDYAQTQNNRAVLLSDLATLPGEDRGQRLREALTMAVSAVRIFGAVQQTQYLAIGRRTLAGLVVNFGATDFRAVWQTLFPDQALPQLTPAELLSALMEQAGIASQADLQARLAHDPSFRTHVADLLALAQTEETAPAPVAVDQAIAEQFISWLQTPDWDASATFLSEHAAELLTDAGAAILQLLQKANPGNEEIALHIKLLAACRQQGIAAAYTQLRRELQAAQLRAQLANLPEAEQRLMALLAVNDLVGMMQLVINTAVDTLDEMERLAEEKMAELEGDEAVALGQRLASLRELRQQDPQQLAAQWATLQQAAQDPVTQALTALFQVTDGATLAQVLEAHPLLLTYPALARLTAGIEQAYAAGQSDALTHSLALLDILLEHYNHRHADKIDPAEQQSILALYTHLLPIADAVDRVQRGTSLRRNAGWALNTLGNHYAQSGQPQAAVDAYRQGIAVDDQNAMLYRNCTGELIGLGELTAAQQTLTQAVQLEPEAERLPQLWCELYAARGDAAQLAAQATAWRDRQPDKAPSHFYLALAALRAGTATQVQTALAQALPLANADDRQSFRETLARLQALWPEHYAALQQMLAQFQEETR